MTPAIDFCCRVGVDSAELDSFSAVAISLEAAEQCKDLVYTKIAGRWSSTLTLLRSAGGGDALQRFANGNSAEWILAFTTRFGPLEQTPEFGAEFRFSILRWIALQGQFRTYWEAFGSKGYPKHWKRAPKNRPLSAQFAPGVEALREVYASNPQAQEDRKDDLDKQFEKRERAWPGVPFDKGYALWLSDAPEGEWLMRESTRLVYGCSTLWRFLLMSLFSCPGERLRRCWRPDCPKPYFMARHLKQNFCSPDCGRWGQKQWNLSWWHRKGKVRRRTRKPGKRMSHALQP